MRALTDFSAQVGEWIHSHEESVEAEVRGMGVVPVTDRYARDEHAQKGGKGGSGGSGADRMDRIIELITSIPGYEISHFQRKALDEILVCIMPVVFGKNTEREQAMYRRRMGWEACYWAMVFLQTSRRAGKTQTLAIVSAAVLAVCPHMKMIWWSLYNETAAASAQEIGGFLLDFGISNFKVNQKRLKLVNPDDPRDKRVIALLGAQNPQVTKTCFLSPLSLSLSLSLSTHKNT